MRTPRLTVVITSLAAVIACRESTTSNAVRAVPSAPAPTIRTSSTSAFTLIREGHRPVFRHGPLHVFVNPNSAHLDLGLPGVALGGADGPRYGLLGGYFAPTILAPDSSHAYRAVIDAGPQSLRVQFFDDGQLALDARILAGAGRPKVALSARGLVAMPADRVQLFGRKAGQPAFSRTLTAGETPAIDVRSADRVEVRSRRHGAYRFETSCPRVYLVSPVPRGSTSVFVVASGSRPPPTDSLYAPPSGGEPVSPLDCGPSTTSTLTTPSPG